MPGPNTLTGEALAHYQAIYGGLDPAAIAARTALPFDQAAGTFSFCLAGFAYRASWPDFNMQPAGDWPAPNDYERILMLRYLSEGTFIPATGEELNYRDMPQASVYERQFQGRVCQRLLREFGNNLDKLRSVFEQHAPFAASPLPKCDLGFRFNLLDGLEMSLRFWRGDEEFEPSVLVLFDKSLQFAFSAEDLAVAGGILIDHLRYLRDRI